jgi:hypothetical protein
MLPNFRLPTAGILIMAFASALATDVEVLAIDAISDDSILADYPVGSPDPDLTLRMTLARGEYEPASFVIKANTAAQELLLESPALADSAGEALSGATVDIRVVKRWYQRNFGDYADSRFAFLVSELLVRDDRLIRVEDGQNSLRLTSGEYVNISSPDDLRLKVVPKPDDFPVRDATDLQPVSLAAGESRQFWVTVHVPEQAAAGDYAGDIRVLDESGEALVVIPVEVEVLPFRLERPLIEYSIYYRGVLDPNRPEGSPSSEAKSRAQMLADFRNLKAHGVTNPLIYQDIGSGLFDDVLELRREAGMDVENMYTLGVNMVDNNEGLVKPRLASEVSQTVSIAREFGAQNVYFFARDEARGEDIEYQYPFWDEVRRNGGRIFAAGWMQTAKFPGNFNTTGGREDLFVSLGTLSREEAARWHSKGRRIFSYMNPAGGNEMPARWRRNYGLLLWQFDYDGAMPYAWQHSFGNAWNDFDHYRHRDTNFAYPTLDQPIDTIEWEGFREGVDDVRYISTLSAAIELAAADQAEIAAAASAWLAELKIRPLTLTDLDHVRRVATGYILALTDAVPAPDELATISDISVSEIEPDGTAYVSWQTSDRVDGALKLTTDAGVATFVDAPAMKSHVVKVSGLEPAGQAAFELGSSTSMIRASGIIDTRAGLNLTDTSGSFDGSELAVRAELHSPFRSSIAVDVDRSLIGWWRFSGEGDRVIDLSSWGNDGELKGNAKRSVGWFGQGISLDGEGSFINFPDIEIEENGTATIEGWFRFRSQAKDSVSNVGLFSGFYQHGDSNHFYFARTNENFTAGSHLTHDTWHHIAVSWDGDASTARLYVDGQYVPITIQRDAEDILAIDGLTIGRSAGYFGGLIGSARNTFAGDIDEVRVWNRVLSIDEIRTSWRAGRGAIELEVAAGDGADWKLIGANAADQHIAP